MNYILTGLGGGLIGGVIGYFIGRHRRKKKENEKKEEAVRDQSAGFEEDSESEPEEQRARPAYHNMLEENGYVSSQIEDDVDEIDNYLAGLENPVDDEDEDDDSGGGEAAYKRAYFINTDDFYTTRMDYEKVTCWYDSATDRLTTVEGDDVTEDVLDSGMRVHDLIHRLSLEGVAYWRDDFSKTTYEIQEEGE